MNLAIETVLRLRILWLNRVPEEPTLLPLIEAEANFYVVKVNL
jgi:hypothetical protein